MNQSERMKWMMIIENWKREMEDLNEIRAEEREIRFVTAMECGGRTPVTRRRVERSLSFAAITHLH